MSLRRLAGAASVAAVLTSAAAAQATVTLYSDAAAFQAALSASTLEDFTVVPLATGLSLDCTNCSIDLGSGRFVDQGLGGIGQRTRIKFDTPITAWGANIDETPSGFGKGLSVSYRLTDGFTTLVVGPDLNGFTGGFFGFTSSDPFVFVGISPGSNINFSSERYNIDNMRFGTARVGGPGPGPDPGPGPAPVPEPAAWALMIAGFGLTGLAIRRRRQLAA